MSLKGTGGPTLHEIDRYDRGVGWMPHPGESMERASHAVAVPNEESDTDDVWLADPIDVPELDELLAEFGTVAGVVCGLDRHTRDAAALANRHGVPVYIPEWMTGVATELNAPVERFGRRLADTGFSAIRIRNSTIPPWQEVGLFDGETLIVPESLGTAGYYRGTRERLGVHPLFRLIPPRESLGGLQPDRLLLGHGEGIHDGAPAAISDALADSRRTAPGLYAKALRSMVGR